MLLTKISLINKLVESIKGKIILKLHPSLIIRLITKKKCLSLNIRLSTNVLYIKGNLAILTHFSDKLITPTINTCDFYKVFLY